MNDYKIFKELNLVLHYFSGDITYPVILAQMSRLQKDPLYYSKYDSFIDLREANLKVDITDIEKYADFVTNDLKIIDKRKAVYLTSKPNEVVITTLLKNHMNESMVDIFVCSTLDVAVKHLKNSKINSVVLVELISEIAG